MQAQRKVYLLFLPSLPPPPHVLTFSFSNHARNKHPNTSKGLGYRIQHTLELGLQINQDQQQKKKNSSRENISIQQGHNNRMHKVSNATLLTGTSQKAGTRRTQPPASTVWYFKNSSTYSVTQTLSSRLVFKYNRQALSRHSLCQ